MFPRGLTSDEPLVAAGFEEDFINSSGIKEFINGTKPMFLTGGYSNSIANKLLPNTKRIVVNGRYYYINESLLKNTINKYKPIYEQRLGI